MSDSVKEVHGIIENLLSLESINEDNRGTVLDSLKTLRNLCACGFDYQLEIVKNQNFQKYLKDLLLSEEQLYSDNDFYKRLQLMGWQLLANSTVNNEKTQGVVWQLYGDEILQQCINKKQPLDPTTDIRLMIIYNILKLPSPDVLLNRAEVLKACVAVWYLMVEQKCSLPIEFLHFIFEDFLVKGARSTVSFYSQLSAEERLSFLDYLHNYLKQDSPNGLVDSFLLQHLSKEFKMKSDCLLRVSSTREVDNIKPQEVYNLLKCIASASGSENYTQFYSVDHSLFLNVSSLLRALSIVSKKVSNDLYKPLNKLEEVAPSSKISRDYQFEITYELKTLLVRCVANLLYKNSTNQAYCHDTQLMPVLLECTTMDARNPLMKEWSILAIRNACIGCPEIQEIIANLTPKGPASSDILKELNLEMGSLRISPGKE
uniref:Atx10homo_assoc domain-containing protein n=1 Tax=Glossina brevipalpis TaxID=37001 RepID=A0A1A9X3W7_9MUSC